MEENAFARVPTADRVLGSVSICANKGTTPSTMVPLGLHFGEVGSSPFPSTTIDLLFWISAFSLLSGSPVL